MSFQDKFIRYSDCEATFVFSASQQEFFAYKGYTNAPKWCPSCRQAIKSERYGNGGYGNHTDMGSSQPRGYGYVEMSSKSTSATAIANMEGRKFREHIINFVEALPASDKNVMIPITFGTSNRLNRRRGRIYMG